MNVGLTLYLRRIERLSTLRDQDRVQLVEGDVLDQDTLKADGREDVISTNLAGDLSDQARVITGAMEELGLKRLISVISKGIYDKFQTGVLAVFSTPTAMQPT